MGTTVPPHWPHGMGTGHMDQAAVCPGPAGLEHHRDRDQTWPSEQKHLKKLWLFITIQQQMRTQDASSWPCLLHTAASNTRLLPPTQLLATSTPISITWLARCSWINFLLSNASWEFQIPEGTFSHEIILVILSIPHLQAYKNYTFSFVLLGCFCLIKKAFSSLHRVEILPAILATWH